MTRFHPDFYISRRKALLSVLAAGGALPGAPAIGASAIDMQGHWPAKPVTIVVGAPPGGQTDFAAWTLITGMQAALGQPVVIDNKAGVTGNIAAEHVLKSPPDGYRLLAGNGIMTITPHTWRRIRMVDPLQLTPIGTMLTSALVLVVPSASPAQDYRQFVRWVQEQGKSGGIDYATSGAGGLTHVTTELWRERIGKPAMHHIPYKGGGPAVLDLMAGRVAGMFEAVSGVSPFIQSGQLRPLMVTGKTRVPILPDVPTAADVGLEDFEIISFIGC